VRLLGIGLNILVFLSCTALGYAAPIEYLRADEAQVESEDPQDSFQYVPELVPEKPKSGSFNRGFFEKDAAKGVFSNSYVQLSQKNAITMLRPMEAALEESEEAPTPLEKDQPSEPEKEKSIFEMDKEEFRAEMLRKYGSPDQNPIVQPHADAPDCYKAASMALQKGDTVLARKYTDCFVRHQKNHQLVMKETMQLAMKSGTERSLSRGEGDADYENIYSLKDDQSVQAGESRSGKADDTSSEFATGTVDNTTAQLIELAERHEPRLKGKYEDAEEDKDEDPLAILFESEEKMRGMARQSRAGVVPRSQDGEVRIYFFFEMDDLDAYAMFPVLERVFQAHKDDLRFHMVGFSLTPLTPTEVAGMAARAKVSFPIRSGSRLGRQFNIGKSTSTVFLAPSSEKFVVEQGIRAFGFVDEMVKMMQAGAPVPKGKR
jgi:hypothetical protein